MSLPKLITKPIKKLKLRQRLHLDDYWPDGWSPAPGMVSITPTYRCNLRCKMCYQRDDDSTPRPDVMNGELTPDHWRKIIDNIVGFVPTLYWIGGEVFIYPQMLELLAYARSTGLNVSLSTNAFSLAKVAAQLVEMGIESLAVSLDGPPEIHNAIRRHPKSYGWVEEGIKAVIAARKAKGCQKPNILLTYTITHQNYRYITEFYHLAQSLQVDVIQFVNLIYMSPATAQHHHQVMQREFGVQPNGMYVLHNEDSHTVDGAFLQQAIDRIRAMASPSPTLKFWPEGSHTYFKQHYGPEKNLPLSNQRCHSIWETLVIQPNGDVTACPFLAEVVVGNVLEQDLKTIWNSPKFKQFRKRVRSQLLPGCVRCTWAEYR